MNFPPDREQTQGGRCSEPASESMSKDERERFIVIILKIRIREVEKEGGRR